MTKIGFLSLIEEKQSFSCWCWKSAPGSLDMQILKDGTHAH